MGHINYVCLRGKLRAFAPAFEITEMFLTHAELVRAIAPARAPQRPGAVPDAHVSAKAS